MITITTEVMIDHGTNCYVWKNYYKNGRLFGFVVIHRDFISVNYYTKEGECKWYFKG